MPRQPRLLVPDVAAHIVQRGNNRAPCFLAESDYLVYLLHLRELSQAYACAVHAFCLMTNHVHLLITPSSATACAGLMRDLGQRYVQYFNRRRGRSGTLWEGRFRSCIAESAQYVLACYRYIELNPVRAGMVQRPGEYRWSSYAANAEGRSIPMLTPHAEYEGLGSDPLTRKAAYRGLFEESLAPPLVVRIRDATAGGYPLVSEHFKAGLAASAERRLERGKAGRPFKSKREDTPEDPEIGL